MLDLKVTIFYLKALHQHQQWVFTSCIGSVLWSQKATLLLLSILFYYRLKIPAVIIIMVSISVNVILYNTHCIDYC